MKKCSFFFTVAFLLLSNLDIFAKESSRLIFDTYIINFKVEKKVKKGMLLTWTSTFESNNTGFSIERTSDTAKKDSWKEIGFVASRVPNTNSQQKYQFLDPQTDYDKFFYRLKCVDNKKNLFYSAVASLPVETKTLFAVEVSPVKENTITVIFDDEYWINEVQINKVVDGRPEKNPLKKWEKVKGKLEITLPGPGTYCVWANKDIDGYQNVQQVTIKPTVANAKN